MTSTLLSDADRQTASIIGAVTAAADGDILRVQMRGPGGTQSEVTAPAVTATHPDGRWASTSLVLPIQVWREESSLLVLGHSDGDGDAVAVSGAIVAVETMTRQPGVYVGETRRRYWPGDVVEGVDHGGMLARWVFAPHANKLKPWTRISPDTAMGGNIMGRDGGLMQNQRHNIPVALRLMLAGTRPADDTGDDA